MPPTRETPARSTQLPIRPIIVNRPIERVERTYVEGYQGENAPRRDTGPIQQIILPPVEQRPERPIIVNIASPTQPLERKRDEPIRSPNRPMEKERTRDTAATTQRPIAETPTPTPEAAAASWQPAHVPDRPAVSIAPNKKSSPKPTKTIPNNSPDRIDSELIDKDKPAPQASLPRYKKKGKIGRQRKYEELGNDDIEPVKEVILFRYQMGRHWPGMSKDMESYYERLYFTRPKKGSKDYDKHKGCWDRKQHWINPTATS